MRMPPKQLWILKQLKDETDLKFLNFCTSQPLQSSKTIAVWDKISAIYMTSLLSIKYISYKSAGK